MFSPLTMLQTLVLLAFPALAIFLTRRVEAMRRLSPVVVCYLFGIFLANLPRVPLDGGLSQSIAEASVPLAIPLLLFSLDLRVAARNARPIALGYGLAVAVVVIVAALAHYAFQARVENSSAVAGMLVGVYTGGTPNMNAIGIALGIDAPTFVKMNAADVLFGGVVFLFLLSVAKPLFGKILPRATRALGAPDEEIWRDDEFEKLLRRDTLRQAANALGLAAAIVIVSIGASAAIFRAVESTFVILLLTSLSIVAGLSARVRALSGPYELGQYVLLVFCVAVGSLADVGALAHGAATIVAFVAVVLFASMALHIALCAAFRVNDDTAIMSATAAIFGPAFIGPVAAAIGNRDLILPGLAASLLGLAVGTYLGIGLAFLLS
ncbi:DUF819 family protein [bacterium]|nr:DUF819 family protein [bacterium]